MSAERGSNGTSKTLALLAGVLLSAAPHAAEDMPDLALLEYLGSWDESDDEWELFTDASADASQADTRGEAVPEDTDSQETDHES